MINNAVVVSRYKTDDLYELFDMIKASFSTKELGIVYEKQAREFWLSGYTEEEIVKMTKTKHLYVTKLNGRII